MVDRLINEHESIILAPAHEILGVPNLITPTGLIPFDELTADAINHYAAITSTSHANAGAGGNVSCAILADGLTLGLTDSEEDDEKSLCEPGNSVNLTDLNFDADLTGFRERTPGNADSVFELWRLLTFAPDVPYIIIHRIGFASDVPFADGQEISVYFALTDLPVDVHADGAKQKIQQVFVPRDATPDTINYVIGA